MPRYANPEVISSCNFQKYSPFGLTSKIYKQFIQLKNRKHNPINNWAEYFNRYFSKEDIQMTIRYMERCSASLIIREVQIKTTMSYHFTLVKMTIIKNSTKNKYGEGVEKRESTRIFCGNVSEYSHYGEDYEDFLKIRKNCTI